MKLPISSIKKYIRIAIIINETTIINIFTKTFSNIQVKGLINPQYINLPIILPIILFKCTYCIT